MSATRIGAMLAKELLDLRGRPGIFVPAIRFPTVPKGKIVAD